MRKNIIITCEHGGNEIPQTYQSYFKGKDDLLTSHRGWDPGALILAQYIAEAVPCNLISERVSRLLIEQNRSITSRSLYSELSRQMPEVMKERLLQEIYLPYHQKVEQEIKKSIKGCGRVVHFSIHSFTPVMDGVMRNADIGLLYDPSRNWEKRVCRELGQKVGDARYRVRMNYPYRGVSDGVTRWLRSRYGGEAYCGVEVEINQRYYFEGGKGWGELKEKMGEWIGGIAGEIAGGNL